MNKKTIIFKLWQFPHLSETFITTQIVTAIELGYDVKILIKELLNIERNKHEDIFRKYDLNSKIIFQPKEEKQDVIKKLLLLVKWIVRKPYLIKYFIKAVLNKGLLFKTLSDINFYSKFRHVSIFHIQYGTNKAPLDFLKSIGLLKGKIIVSFHGHDTVFPINGFIPQENYYTLLIQNIYFAVANTSYLSEQLIKIGFNKNKITIVPVGVDTDYFQIKTNFAIHSSLKIITVGRLDPIKGHLFLINAIQLLKNRGCSVQLSIVGEGDYRDTTQEEINRLNLQSNVCLQGAKSQNGVRGLLHTHDIFVFPSVGLPNGRRETQGLATLEAQSCGLPAIIFDSGGTKYTVENGVTGFICKEGDIIDLANKIELFCIEPALVKKMGLQARKFIENEFSLEVINRKWKNLYGV